jgi:drug/metabolite transporter (DMT)-like permease
VLPLLGIVAVTVLWGVTFVRVKDALELYPLFAFLAVRFAIATGVLVFAGILVAEPAAAEVMGRLAGRSETGKKLL